MLGVDLVQAVAYEAVWTFRLEGCQQSAGVDEVSVHDATAIQKAFAFHDQQRFYRLEAGRNSLFY